MKKEINGVLLEFDVFEVKNAELYQKKLTEIQKHCDKIKDETDFAKGVKEICNMVFDFIDTLFGAGKHAEIFGDSVNLKTAISVYNEIVAAVSEDKEEFVNFTKSLNKNQIH